MSTPNVERSRRREVMAVLSLVVIAVVLAIALLIVLPALARMDPVSPNVMKHRLREAFCKPRIEQRMECLHECAVAAGEDYAAQACELLPEAEPTEADQRRLEAELYQKSPCAQQCAVNWKTHSLWCSRSIEQAKVDAVDACIFEGATIAAFDWREERCRARCASEGSAPDSAELAMTSADTCTILCVLGGLVEEPAPDQIRKLAYELAHESDWAAQKLLAPYQPYALPGAFEQWRWECRQQHTRATWNEPLETKRAKEATFRDCVRQRLDTAPIQPPTPAGCPPCP